MNDGNVTIRVSGVERDAQTGEMQEEQVRFAKGYCLRKEETVELAYEEAAEENGPAGQVRLSLSEAEATLEKRGEASARFHFLPGQKTELRYETDYGVILLAVETEHVMMRELQDSLLAEIRYRLLADDEAISSHTLQILAEGEPS